VRKFLIESLEISTVKSRPAWVTKRQGDRTATVRFTDEVTLESLEKLTSGNLTHDDEIVKCDIISAPDDESRKKQRTDQDMPTQDQIVTHVLPLLNEPYEDQLEAKRNDVVSALADALKLVQTSAKSRSFTPLPTWDDLKIEETISGLSDGYRNKCEFTIGPDSNGVPEIGFILRRATAHSEPVVVPGENLIHVSSQLRDIVVSFRPVLRQLVAQNLPLFSHISKQGCWRMMMVRACPITNESQVIVQCGPIADPILKSSLQSSLITWAQSTHITSLFVQYNSGFTDSIAVSSTNEMRLIHGPESIHMAIETASGNHLVKYRVNPLSFFQTNSKGCQKLYGRVAEFIGANSSAKKSRVIFDVCCGVGSIGIFLAASLGQSVERTVGVDIVPEAIENARENAKLNNLDNCEYIAGRAESVMDSVVAKELAATGNDNTEFICVVDPPRVGLHKSVIKAIRGCEAIKTVVYVSCNPKSLSADLGKFCEPLTSSPDEEGIAVNHRFIPQSALAVDMFPHTPHCEVVVKLVRP